MDKRFDQIDARFGQVDVRFAEMENKLQIHVIFSIVGVHYDVPRLTDRLYAAEKTIDRHTEQIQALNHTVGIAE